MANETRTQDDRSRTAKASGLNGGRDKETSNRQVGHGVIAAHAIGTVCVTILAGLSIVDGLVAVLAFLLMFAAVWGADIYVQYQDMRVESGAEIP